MGREAFTIRTKAATMNDVAYDKSCAAMDVNGDDIFFRVTWNNFFQFFKLGPAGDTVRINNTQNFTPV